MQGLVYKKKERTRPGLGSVFKSFFLLFWSQALAMPSRFWYTYSTDEMNIVPYLLPKFGRWGKVGSFFLCTLAI